MAIFVLSIIILSMIDKSIISSDSSVDAIKSIINNLTIPPPVNGFGPYNLKVLSMTKCLGPRLKNGTDYNTTVTQTANEIKAEGETRILKSLKNIRAEIEVYTMKSDFSYNMITKYHVENACENYIARSVMFVVFHTSSECVIKSGVYKIPPMSIDNMVNYVFGNNLPYGRLIVKSNYYTPKFNIACDMLIFDVSPNHVK